MIANLTSSDITVTQEQRENIVEQFPMLNELSDSGAKEKLVRLWVRAMKMSGYDRVEKMPNEDSDASVNSLAAHCRAVTNAATNIGKAFRQVYGADIHFDHIIAAGVVHDLDKPMCYTFDENGAMVLTEFGRTLPHGCYSAYAALDEGLPIEVAHVARCHSAYSSSAHSGTIEGIFIEYADKGIARALKVACGGYLPVKTGIGG